MTATFTRDPSQIRADSGVLIVPAEARAVIANALDIADESAEAMIECETASYSGEGREWHDLESSIDPDLTDETNARIRSNLDQAARYLEARGLLDRHAEREQLVSFKDPPA